MICKEKSQAEKKKIRLDPRLKKMVGVVVGF